MAGAFLFAPAAKRQKRPTSEIKRRGVSFGVRDKSRPACPFRQNYSAKCKIPKTRRYSKVTRYGIAMMTEMPEPVAAHPRPFAKVPTVHRIVNQKVRYVSDDQPACGSEGNFDVPKQCEEGQEERKAGDADPNRRSIEVAWARVVHPMEFPDDSYLMVDETMQEIFNERPQYRSTHKGQPPARVQSEAPAVELIEQQSDDNERVEKEVGIVTDLGLAHPLISTERNSTLQLFRNRDAKATAGKPFLVAILLRKVA
jgi:hypothetical protein